ncbi:hypothetical protein K1X76_08245 [bacterium]|nr:hypothetical protein [bacterium]
MSLILANELNVHRQYGSLTSEGFKERYTANPNGIRQTIHNEVHTYARLDNTDGTLNVASELLTAAEIAVSLRTDSPYRYRRDAAAIPDNIQAAEREWRETLGKDQLARYTAWVRGLSQEAKKQHALARLGVPGDTTIESDFAMVAVLRFLQGLPADVNTRPFQTLIVGGGLVNTANITDKQRHCVNLTILNLLTNHGTLEASSMCPMAFDVWALAAGNASSGVHVSDFDDRVIAAVHNPGIIPLCNVNRAGDYLGDTRYEALGINAYAVRRAAAVSNRATPVGTIVRDVNIGDRRNVSVTVNTYNLKSDERQKIKGYLQDVAAELLDSAIPQCDRVIYAGTAYMLDPILARAAFIKIVHRTAKDGQIVSDYLLTDAEAKILGLTIIEKHYIGKDRNSKDLYCYTYQRININAPFVAEMMAIITEVQGRGEKLLAAASPSSKPPAPPAAPKTSVTQLQAALTEAAIRTATEEARATPVTGRVVGLDYVEAWLKSNDSPDARGRTKPVAVAVYGDGADVNTVAQVQAAHTKKYGDNAKFEQHPQAATTPLPAAVQAPVHLSVVGTRGNDTLDAVMLVKALSVAGGNTQVAVGRAISREDQSKLGLDDEVRRGDYYVYTYEGDNGFVRELMAVINRVQGEPPSTPPANNDSPRNARAMQHPVLAYRAQLQQLGYEVPDDITAADDLTLIAAELLLKNITPPTRQQFEAIQTENPHADWDDLMQLAQAAPSPAGRVTVLMPGQAPKHFDADQEPFSEVLTFPDTAVVDDTVGPPIINADHTKAAATPHPQFPSHKRVSLNNVAFDTCLTELNPTAPQAVNLTKIYEVAAEWLKDPSTYCLQVHQGENLLGYGLVLAGDDFDALIREETVAIFGDDVLVFVTHAGEPPRPVRFVAIKEGSILDRDITRVGAVDVNGVLIFDPLQNYVPPGGGGGDMEGEGEGFQDVAPSVSVPEENNGGVSMGGVSVLILTDPTICSLFNPFAAVLQGAWAYVTGLAHKMMLLMALAGGMEGGEEAREEVDSGWMMDGEDAGMPEESPVALAPAQARSFGPRGSRRLTETNQMFEGYQKNLGRTPIRIDDQKISGTQYRPLDTNTTSPFKNIFVPHDASIADGPVYVYLAEGYKIPPQTGYKVVKDNRSGNWDVFIINLEGRGHKAVVETVSCGSIAADGNLVTELENFARAPGRNDELCNGLLVLNFKKFQYVVETQGRTAAKQQVVKNRVEGLFDEEQKLLAIYNAEIRKEKPNWQNVYDALCLLEQCYTKLKAERDNENKKGRLVDRLARVNQQRVRINGWEKMSLTRGVSVEGLEGGLSLALRARMDQPARSDSRGGGNTHLSSPSTYGPKATAIDPFSFSFLVSSLAGIAAQIFDTVQEVGREVILAAQLLGGAMMTGEEGDGDLGPAAELQEAREEVDSSLLMVDGKEDAPQPPAPNVSPDEVAVFYEERHRSKKGRAAFQSKHQIVNEVYTQLGQSTNLPPTRRRAVAKALAAENVNSENVNINTWNEAYSRAKNAIRNFRWLQYLKDHFATHIANLVVTQKLTSDNQAYTDKCSRLYGQVLSYVDDGCSGLTNVAPGTRVYLVGLVMEKLLDSVNNDTESDLFSKATTLVNQWKTMDQKAKDLGRRWDRCAVKGNLRDFVQSTAVERAFKKDADAEVERYMNAWKGAYDEVVGAILENVSYITNQEKQFLASIIADVVAADATGQTRAANKIRVFTNCVGKYTNVLNKARNGVFIIRLATNLLRDGFEAEFDDAAIEQAAHNDGVIIKAVLDQAIPVANREFVTNPEELLLAIACEAFDGTTDVQAFANQFSNTFKEHVAAATKLLAEDTAQVHEKARRPIALTLARVFMGGYRVDGRTIEEMTREWIRRANTAAQIIQGANIPDARFLAGRLASARYQWQAHWKGIDAEAKKLQCQWLTLKRKVEEGLRRRGGDTAEATQITQDAFKQARGNPYDADINARRMVSGADYSAYANPFIVAALALVGSYTLPSPSALLMGAAAGVVLSAVLGVAALFAWNARRTSVDESMEDDTDPATDPAAPLVYKGIGKQPGVHIIERNAHGCAGTVLDGNTGTATLESDVVTITAVTDIGVSKTPDNPKAHNEDGCAVFEFEQDGKTISGQISVDAIGSSNNAHLAMQFALAHLPKLIVEKAGDVNQALTELQQMMAGNGGVEGKICIGVDLFEPQGDGKVKLKTWTVGDVRGVAYRNGQEFFRTVDITIVRLIRDANDNGHTSKSAIINYVTLWVDVVFGSMFEEARATLTSDLKAALTAAALPDNDFTIANDWDQGHHPLANVVLTSLGKREEGTIWHYQEKTLEPGDVYVRASDGLWNNVKGDEANNKTADQLVTDAKSRMRDRDNGRPDNINVLVAKINVPSTDGTVVAGGGRQVDAKEKFYSHPVVAHLKQRPPFHTVYAQVRGLDSYAGQMGTEVSQAIRAHQNKTLIRINLDNPLESLEGLAENFPKNQEGIAVVYFGDIPVGYRLFKFSSAYTLVLVDVFVDAHYRGQGLRDLMDLVLVSSFFREAAQTGDDLTVIYQQVKNPNNRQRYREAGMQLVVDDENVDDENNDDEWDENGSWYSPVREIDIVALQSYPSYGITYRVTDYRP